ncbi:MAG TPA: hypothetical protein EYN96_02120 [Candidatus Hydrogenedentes bacterium]|nr:hypothetical protein [Candidatus Hydrogenedentota bacterium]
MISELLLYGIFGIIGSLTIAAGDMFLLGNRVSGKTFRQRKLDNLLHVSTRNMWIGHTIGVLAIPIVFFGIYQIYLGLSPAGGATALVPPAIMMFMMVVGGAGHACFAFLGGAMQLHASQNPEEGSPIDNLVKAHRKLLTPLFAAFLLSLLAFSIAFAVIVWTIDTSYPKWIAITNPLVLFIATGKLAGLLPAPMGGYVRPATGNIAFAIFFGLSTFALVN